MYEKQPDLFNNFKQTSKKSIWHEQKTPLQNGKQTCFFVSREHMFFASCGFILLILLAYSLGVNHGKHINSNNEPQAKNVAEGKDVKNEPVKTKEAVTETITTAQSEDTPKEPTTIEPVKSKTYYTIQVATYKNKSRAEKEIELLKSKELYAFFEPKGIYFQVYVGNYSTSAKAGEVLAKLQNRYEDAFIRKITP